MVLAGLQPEKFASVALAAMAEASEADALDLWRSLLATKGAAKHLAIAIRDARPTPAVAQAGLRVAREAARPDAGLLEALTPFASVPFRSQELTPEQIKEFAAKAAHDGDPVRGDLPCHRGRRRKGGAGHDQPRGQRSD